MINILLTGFYGRGNFGDDLIISCLVDWLADHRDIKIVVLSADTAVAHNWRTEDVDVLPRTACGYWRGIGVTDVVMIGGGTIFHDNFNGTQLFRCWKVLLFWLIKVTSAKLRTRTVLIAGAGVGPLSSRLGRLLSFLTLVQCMRIGVRDSPSAASVESLNLRSNIVLGFDLAALGLDRVRGAASGMHNATNIIGISPVSFSIFMAKGKEHTASYWRECTEAIAIHMAVDRNLKVKIFALSRGDKDERDDGVARYMRERLEASFPNRTEMHFYEGRVWATVDAMRACSWFIASRYHALLTTYLCGCRIAAVPYNRKVRDLALQIGIGEDAILPTSRIVRKEEWNLLIQRLRSNDAAFIPSLAPQGAKRQAAVGLVATLGRLAHEQGK